MTVTRIKHCDYCSRPSITQAEYFTDSGELIETGNAAVCQAHDFQMRYRNSPFYEIHRAEGQGCPECGHDYAELYVPYTLVTESGETVSSERYAAMTLSMEWDISDNTDDDIYLNSDYAYDTALSTISAAISAQPATAQLLEVPHLHNEGTGYISRADDFDALMDTIEFGTPSAYCSNCSHTFSAYF